MNYTPNHQLFSSVFVLPSAIADAQLHLASGAQLKVILAVYRSQNEPFDAQKIAQKTGLHVAEVLDACAYWAQQGMLLCDGIAAPAVLTESPAHTAADAVQTDMQRFAEKDVSPQQAAAPAGEPQSDTAPVQTEKQTKEKITVSPSRPTHAQICKRLDESEELRILFNEAQTVLGRMLGTGDQAALLLLYDYYGLPADVLLMLCEYARTMGKAGNLNYIYAVGQDWSEREIDTFERADEELRRLSQIDTDWTALCSLTGLQHAKPTKSQQNYLRSWTGEWKFSMQMVALAFEKMQERTDGVRFSYMNGILKNWHAKGISTPEQVEKEELAFKEKTQETQQARKTAATPNGISAGVSAAVIKSGTAGTPASYDLEKAEREARENVPTLRKRKKKTI